ncbi:MAG: type II toxin-antitoxin system prevent-host-death family antitoxin [Dehalococcoidia bacterium]
MQDNKPTTHTLPASVARDEWDRVLDRVAHKVARVVVERSGVPIAAIVSADDLERLDRYDAERAHDFAILDEVGQAFEGVSPDEIDREADAAVSAVRAEMRRERTSPGDE